VATAVLVVGGAIALLIVWMIVRAVWMAGMAGPYEGREEGFDQPARRVFSRFEPFDTRSPEEHLAALQRAT